MPCEPVTEGVPTHRPNSSANPPSSLAFRMKRLGSGSGARRALTALGTNDTQLNVRLARSLLTISQEKFAKKWNFDPVREVPLPQGRFYWTPTVPATQQGSSSEPSCCQLVSSVTSSGSGSSLSSHDLVGLAAEAEDNAAALRTCLNLPPRANNTTTMAATTQPADVVGSPEPRVPPTHPTEAPCTPERIIIVAPMAEPSNTFVAATPSPPLAAVAISPEARVPPPHPAADASTPTATVPGGSSISCTSRPGASVVASDAIVRVVVDNEGNGCDATVVVQDNQCQHQGIDPLSSPSSLAVTDIRHPQTSAPLTQTCITNYLRPRKRSSAHLQEAVHPSKTKKVLVAA